MALKLNPFSPARKAGKLPPATSEGERIYAIGDVHGCYDELRALLERIEDHAMTLPSAHSTHVMLLGDLIDRGPASRQVLRFAFEVQSQTDKMVVLLGNHEQLMLDVLDGKAGMLRAWLRIGGAETLESFGIAPPSPEMDPLEAADMLREAIPAEWIDWLRTCPVKARSGDYLFCHAGIRPGVPIKRQSSRDMLWIRDEFLEDTSDHGVVVVHGHSITDDVEVRANRIGIDTGAYRTGVLSALYLEGPDRDVISTSGHLRSHAA